MVQHRPGALPRIRSTVVGIPAGLPAPPAGPRALRPFGTRALKIPDSGGLLRGQLTVPCPWWAASGAPSRSLPVLEGAEAGAPSFLQDNPFNALVQHCPITLGPPYQPLAAVSMVEASSHCCDSKCPRVNQRGYLLGTTETRWWG